VLEGDRVLVLDRIEGFAFVKAAIEESHKTLGSAGPSPLQEAKRQQQRTREYRELSYELPVVTTALGRVLLAYLPGDEVRGFLRHDSRVKRPSQSNDAMDLSSELAKVRAQGYCMMHFEPHNESCALAAPIFDANDTVKAAVSVSCKRHLSIWNDEHALSETVRAPRGKSHRRCIILTRTVLCKRVNHPKSGPNKGPSPWSIHVPRHRNFNPSARSHPSEG
jgi:hypothetical protein